MPQIGDRITFWPAAYSADISARMAAAGRQAGAQVTGRISYITRRHGNYTVTFEVDGYPLTESFKF